MNIKKVCFVCSGRNLTALSEFLPLANYLQKSNLKPFFIIDGEPKKEVLDKILKKNLKYYINKNKESQLKTEKKKQKKNNRSVKNLKTLIPIRLRKVLKENYELLNLIIKLNNDRKIISHVLLLEKPTVIIVPGDRGIGKNLMSIRFAKSKNIKVLYLQVAANNIDFLYTSHREKNSSYNANIGIANKVFAKFYPDQVRKFSNKEILFYRWHEMIALILFNTLPVRPWFNGDSYADKSLFISTNDMIEDKSKGAICANASVVGQFSHDALFRIKSKKVEQKKYFQKKYFSSSSGHKSIIIFSLPQFYEHNIYSKTRSMDEINLIIDNLSNLKSHHVFISLHPKMDFKNYEYINKLYKNIQIIKERLSEALPVADYFISVFESTISWALLCNVIPIFLDYYKLNFDLKKFDSCQIFKKKTQFNEDFQKIIDNRKILSLHLQKDNESLPPFDGNSGKRIFNEIAEIQDDK